MSLKIKLRLFYLLLIPFTIWLGLSTRLPSWKNIPLMNPYAGDVLYATLIVFGLRLLALRPARWKISTASFVFCVLIELQQLYRADWIIRLRHTPPFGLILGFDFSWTDICCYALGVLIGHSISALGEKGLQ
ncbi:uncharacterized protein DUF2809 [Chitinophaga dinghuensis]|uniref:Uncharacterized protein DUF2809 n=1 Tax=Chitinophaga dinghuensis TaxID=1539050 RepID=A0A327W2S2_9BACT|nr:DUF2809 domain-containing protein [Chitinophaga dinghuensis]RAJ83581.1 uncharacterized protein DUF2809 [Chitinophaga dinghuensis]